MKELKGIITAMVTPFDETEKMDITAAKKMARWLVDNGVHGLFICGTNGEQKPSLKRSVMKLPFVQVLGAAAQNKPSN